MRSAGYVISLLIFPALISLALVLSSRLHAHIHRSSRHPRRRLLSIRSAEQAISLRRSTGETSGERETQQSRRLFLASVLCCSPSPSFRSRLSLSLPPPSLTRSFLEKLMHACTREERKRVCVCGCLSVRMREGSSLLSVCVCQSDCLSLTVSLLKCAAPASHPSLPSS